MKDFKLEDYIKKLESLDKDDSVRMIWQWMKQGDINLKQFKILVKYLN